MLNPEHNLFLGLKGKGTRGIKYEPSRKFEYS